MGGTLDVNGNSLTFHQLKAADYGAVLANNVDKRATITLDYALRADKVALNGWSESGKGTAGNLYKYNNPYTNTTDYFILKQSTYGYFPHGPEQQRHLGVCGGTVRGMHRNW